MTKSPQGFIVVLPGEIIEIAQDDDISWLTLFYALPKELAETYPDALKIPRSPYEVLYEGSYGAVAKSDMLKMLVNFRTHRQSYKSKKKIENPQYDWKIFENTHDAIVDEETFYRVQELRKNKRRPARTGKSNMFSGVVRCADCGEKLYYYTSKNFEARQDHVICSTTRRRGPETCTSHFI